MNRYAAGAARTFSLLTAAVALAAAALASAPVAAQAWPQRPVRLVIPYAPGGGSDFLGRVASERLTRGLGQQFVSDNRPGASGTIGSDLVAKATPDGYTLVVSGIGSHVVAPAATPTPYDPMRDFAHIAFLGGFPAALSVPAASGARTVKEFVTRSAAEGITCGTPGLGTHAHLIALLFGQKSGAKLVPVPYKGGGPAVADVVGNQIQASLTTLGAAAGQVRAGRLRVLALTSAKRLADYPDIPTFSEQGLPELTASTWFGLSGPAGMPKAIVARLNREVRTAMAQPDIQSKFRADGIEANDFDPGAFTAYVRAEIRRWAPLVKAAKK
jgi:tripartite-type tricarboxylate transporter receptor subunit TctC